MRAPRNKAIRYRTYLLALLAAILTFNYVDYQAIGLVLQNIKETFRVSDTELGLMTGIAFTLFYSTLGIPIGRWADRGNRIAIIAITVGLRSIMVMLMGGARSFAELMLIRVGVAVGEAGCLPPAYSLIADHFGHAERPRAVALFLIGAPLSAMIGNFAGGWLNELYGWRTMFVLLGIPGLVLMAMAWLTLKEPRSASREQVRERRPAAPISDVVQALWTNRTFRHVLAMLCLNFFFASGAGQWQAAFFMRSFGFDTMDLGVWFALIFGVGGVVGTYCGGSLASRYAPRDERRQLRILAVLNVSFGVVSAIAYLSDNAHISLALTGLAAIGLSLQAAPLLATLQTVVPETMLATSISIVYLFANLVGAGLGPVAVGALSDGLRQALGNESLRYALLATCPGYLWGAWHLWRGAQTVAADAESAAGGRVSTQVNCVQA